MEYQKTPGGAIVGFDIDLAGAVAKALGLKLVVTNTSNFSELTVSIETKRTDISDSSVTDFTSRESTVHFVDDFQSGVQFLGLSKVTSGLNSYTAVCGKTVVIQTGTAFASTVAALSKKVCPSNNQIKTLGVAQPPDELQQVQLGRAFAVAQGPESNGYTELTQPGKWRVIGKTFHPYFYGMMFNKSNTQLGVALRAALQSLIKNGQYAKILAKWDLKGDGVKSATINHGVAGN
jgi:polar amino acid transport system substrate-binding protein